MKPKFRYLSDDELKYFEEELKQFLIVNHVYGEEWLKINQENPEKALDLVALFSNQVLERVYKNIKYLEIRSISACIVCFFDKQELLMRKITSDKELDFSSTESIHKVFQTNLEDIQILKSHKKYEISREMEIHQALENGAIPSSLEFWDFIEKLIQ